MISANRQQNAGANMIRIVGVFMLVMTAGIGFVERRPGLAGRGDISIAIVFILLAAYIFLVTYKKYYGGMQSFLGCALVLLSVSGAVDYFFWSATPPTSVLNNIIFFVGAILFGGLLLLWGYERHHRLVTRATST